MKSDYLVPRLMVYLICYPYNLVDVIAALINWQGFCELYGIDAIDTLSDVPDVLYIPTEVIAMC